VSLKGGVENDVDEAKNMLEEHILVNVVETRMCSNKLRLDRQYIRRTHSCQHCGSKNVFYEAPTRGQYIRRTHSCERCGNVNVFYEAPTR